MSACTRTLDSVRGAYLASNQALAAFPLTDNLGQIFGQAPWGGNQLRKLVHVFNDLKACDRSLRAEPGMHHRMHSGSSPSPRSRLA